MVVEVATLLNPNTHGVEKVGTFEVRHHRHLFVFGWDIAGDAEVLRVAGTLVSQGQMRGQCGRTHAWRVAQAVEKGGVKCEHALLVISRAGKVDEGRKRIGAVETGIAMEDVERRSRKKTAADQNNETDAELQTEQKALADPSARCACNCRTTFMQRLLL